MELGLQGKVALITGGSRGIGLRTAHRFADEGCHIAICGRDPAPLATAAEELGQKGVRVAAIQADVTQPAEAAQIIEQSVAQLGGIDILVNNVGGATGGRLLEATDEDWLRTFELNVFQIVRMTRLAVPHLRQRGSGAIVNVASISGWQAQLAGTAQYGSSKAAAIFMTERLALELVHDQIRVNIVSPGSIIWEGGSWDRFRQRNPASFDAYVRDGFPMGRLGAPEEVADVIVFLASPRAHWVNGRHIPVDGLEQPTPVQEYRPW
ncbi:MAG TPA: SDR family oxidoreductase [Caldilineaceae bacterium]|nr:SDR family oxidoreductase [Caldilineaceae bacterium]